MVSLSILIPTAGRETLRRTLESVAPQMQDGDKVVICFDTHDPLPADAVTEGYRKRIVRTLFHDAGHHCWGHCQLNEGMKHATGEYLVFQDDDDVFTPDACQRIRAAIAELPQPTPLLFRFLTHYRQVAWAVQEIMEGNLGGHNLVVPNVPELLGTWTERYEGDFDFVSETLANWKAQGVDPVWRKELIAVARPEEAMWRRMQAHAAAR